MVAEANPDTAVGPLVFSGSYCSAAGTAANNHYNRFLVGTVWTDLNGNGRYDPGEGLNNVRVQPDRWDLSRGDRGGGRLVHSHDRPGYL